MTFSRHGNVCNTSKDFFIGLYMPMCVRGLNVSFGIDIHEANKDPSRS